MSFSGNNRQAVFRASEDYRRYLGWLAEAAAQHGCAIHAYVLMTNHVHLLLTPRKPNSLPRTMQLLGRRYVRYFNSAYRRTGTLWEGPYKAALIDSENYFLVCSRYIELNPVRVGAVRHPRDYPWSSFRAHAYGNEDALLAPHPLYRALGRSGASRQEAYRALFREALDEEAVAGLRAATQGGWTFGSELFKREIAAALRRRVSPLPPGPKPNARNDTRQMILL